MAQKQELQPQTQVIEQVTPQIPPKPVMSAEAAAYPKLLKIYKELNHQNGIIFDAERERNELELERDSLKGFARLTKKGELQNRIDRKNEEIDLLKVGLSGIVKRYGFQTVHDFSKPLLLLKKLMMITEIRLKSGKNDMAKKCEGGKKAYTDGYRIFRERMRFDNQDKSLKEKTGEKDNYTHYI